jgi:hypothetical protein
LGRWGVLPGGVVSIRIQMKRLAAFIVFVSLLAGKGYSQEADEIRKF